MKSQLFILACSASLALIGCGGGGGGGGGATLSGTVAVGAPLAGATVEVIDANGVTRSTTAAADGTYSISTAGLVAPLVIRATGDLGDTVVRLSSAVASLETSTTANVTPLTEAAVASMSTDYDAKTIAPSQITASGLSAAMSQIMTSISNVATAVGYSGTNPIQDSFLTDSTGLDALLDAVAIEPSAAGINIVNKGKAITDIQTPETVVLSRSGTTVSVSGQLSSPDALLGTKLPALQQKINDCFAVPASNRLTVSYTDSTGERTPDATSLNAACSSFISADYRQNGKSFAFRWVDDLAPGNGLTTSDSEPVGGVTIISRFAVPTATVNVFEYVVDITWKDKDGVGYARPEVVRLNGQGNLELYGNRRGYTIFAEPTITVFNAQRSDFTSGQSNNRTEGRIRILANPYLSGGAYQYTTTPSAGAASNTLVPLPTLGCVWVTGAYISEITNHDPLAPKGGLLLKTPHTDVTGSQNYMAISRQYLASFDPLNDQSHLNRLLEDCKSYADGQTGFGSAPNQSTDPNAYTTHRTNNNYTIDLHVPDGSLFTFDSTDADTNSLRHASNGHGPVFAPSMLTPAARLAADAVVLPRYTFYVIGRSVPSTVDATTASVSDFKNRTGTASTYLLDVMTTRMGRALPTLTDVTKIVTPTLSAAVIASYLRSDGSGASQVSVLSLNWTNASANEVWAQRVGAAAFYRRDATSVFAPSRVSDSLKVKKTESSKDFTLDEPLPSFASVSGQYGNPLVNIHSVSREIWLRGVDSRGRQIQPLWSFEQLR